MIVLLDDTGALPEFVRDDGDPSRGSRGVPLTRVMVMAVRAVIVGNSAELSFLSYLPVEVSDPKVSGKTIKL